MFDLNHKKGNEMTHIELSSIGSRLKFVRKSKGLSQEEMADLIDVSLSSYRNYETNVNAISHITLEKIAKETKTSLDFLVSGKELLQNKIEVMTLVRQNTQFETKIDNGDMVITARIPLHKYIGA